MLLFDVNIYVYAHREDTPQHPAIKAYLQSILESDAPFGYSLLAFSAFLRIVTHPRIFALPSDLDIAISFVSEIINLPNAVQHNPGPAHWAIFTELCAASGAKGNLIPDAYFAALAIETGCTWITTDRDYSRFRQLSWQHPLTR